MTMPRVMGVAGLALMLALPASGGETISQEDFDALAACGAERLAVRELLFQHAEDWKDVHGAEGEAGAKIAAIETLAWTNHTLVNIFTRLLDAVEESGAGLDSGRALAAYQAAVESYFPVMDLPREERMAHIESDAFAAELSADCEAVGILVQDTVGAAGT